MYLVEINKIPGFQQWRDGARVCLQANLPPTEVLWRSPDNTVELSLFDSPATLQPSLQTADDIRVSPAFIRLAETAACHQDPERFALLYRILWRLIHENKQLLQFKTDDDILRLERIVHAVRRDAYKITAFLRFREIRDEQGPHFVAWYEPEHYTLEMVLPFFQTRFCNMRWAILTPYRAAHWDGNEISLADNPDPALYPAEDAVETYWLQYYSSIFNPARIKEKAMLTQMPKKYWKNLPEAHLIPNLLRDANGCVHKMVEQSQSGSK